MRTGMIEYFSRRRGILALLFPLLAAPTAWFVHLNVSYSLVRWVCRTGAIWVLHVTTAATLLLAAAGAVVAWRAWRRTGATWQTTDGPVVGRSRFLALSGLALGVGFFLVIIVQAAPNFILEPCP